MDEVDDTSKAHSGRNHVSAETSPRTPLQQRIEAQRAQLLQAHGVLRCLHDALLYAADDDALIYAEAAHVAANLINNTAELDSVHTGPLIEA
jgi:streptomycin 6-kinase